MHTYVYTPCTHVYTLHILYIHTHAHMQTHTFNYMHGHAHTCTHTHVHMYTVPLIYTCAKYTGAYICTCMERTGLASPSQGGRAAILAASTWSSSRRIQLSQSYLVPESWSPVYGGSRDLGQRSPQNQEPGDPTNFVGASLCTSSNPCCTMGFRAQEVQGQAQGPREAQKTAWKGLAQVARLGLQRPQRHMGRRPGRN